MDDFAGLKPSNRVRIPIKGEDVLCSIGTSLGETVYHVLEDTRQFVKGQRICGELMHYLLQNSNPVREYSNIDKPPYSTSESDEQRE